MNIFQQGNVIAAVKTAQDLEVALSSGAQDIFLLKANINTVSQWVDMCHSANKRVFIHTDLAEGFGKDDASLQYIADVIKPDGILSTKIGIVRTAIQLGLYAVYRVFLIDQQSMNSALANIDKYHPYAVEIMPGVAYDAIRELSDNAKDVHIIAGGFIKTKQSVAKAIESGALTCSTSSKQLWGSIL